jgi:hypothetical protein
MEKKKIVIPPKICALCGRTFMWRKKWARDWANVLYCSDKCRGSRTKNLPGKAAAPV